MTTPHELAEELGQRVHMAVREGGRELLVNLRPPDLGHLTIRVTMTDGVLQAQIMADRPEAAKLLQQTLGTLDSALGDLGYSMGDLDVAYGGGRDAQASSQGSAGATARGDAEAGEAADGAQAPSATTSTGTGDTPGLDLLA
jgi:flagellar hook-length control protein FliK